MSGVSEMGFERTSKEGNLPTIASNGLSISLPSAPCPRDRFPSRPGLDSDQWAFDDNDNIVIISSE